MDLGRYRLNEPLASSARSETFLATTGADSDAQQVVLERLLPSIEPKSAAVFVEDAYLASRLFHPNIVQTLEVGKAGDAHYVTRERVDGIDMLGFLREHVRAGRTPDPGIAAWIAHELLEALDYAHRVSDGRGNRIVHGRITMTNVLLGVGGEVKLGGFAMPRPFELDGAAALSDVGHTSPEHVNGQPIDARSDVFSIGVVLAELLVGRRLFLAGHDLDVLVMVRDVDLDRFESRVGELDRFLVEITRRALRKDITDRWTTAAEFRDALTGWLREQRRTTMRDELALLVRELRIARERHGAAEPAPEIDFKFGRAPTGPPVSPPKTLLGVTGRRTPPNGTPAKKIVTIPQIGALPPGRRTRPGPAVPAAIPTVRMATPQPSEPEVATLPPSNTTTPGMPPPREPGVVEAIDPDAGETTPPSGRTSLGMPPLREPGIQLQLDAPVLLTADEEAAARAIHHSLVVDLDRAPDDTGGFAEAQVRVLFALMRSRATGLLVVVRGATKQTIHLRDGQPQTLWSNEATDLFGRYLVAKNVMSESQLAAAVSKAGLYRGRLDDTLVKLGFVNPIAMLRHLKRYVSTQIVELCTWTESRYAWFAGKQDRREAFPLEGDSFAILGEAALALGDDVLDRWLAQHGRAKLQVAREPRVAAERFQVEGLTEALDQLDGVRSIDALLTRERDRIERARLGRLLYLLVTCELAVP